MTRIKVLLADDHAVLRDSLAAFLGLFEEFEVIGQAADGLEAIEQTLRLRPDVLLLDMGMPNLSGLEVTIRLKRDLPGCKIIILSQYHDPDYVLPVLEAGADGYILKKAGGAEVSQAIKAVYNGQAYLHPAVAQTVLETSLRGRARPASSLEGLTNREREVLTLIGQGQTNQQIAQGLAVSPKTVDKHRASLLQKLNLATRADLIRFALEHKIL